ncbi:MAG: PEP-CTERM sorting domain-containing protein [Opitutales bacterium]|nr:PEP-CTERM sorting domain-containing protein [Opitutales bacterium]
MKKISCILLLCISSASLNAQVLTNITFGSLQDATSGALWHDNDFNSLDSGDGLLAIGYFEVTPSSFLPTASTFDDFIVLADSSSFGSPVSGFLRVEAPNVDITDAVGIIPYVALFTGITDFENIEDATGFGLFQDSSWDSLQGAEPPTPTPDLFYNFGPDSISDVLIGSEIADATVSGDTDSGFGYTTAIPEPSTYAAIFGLGVLGFVVLRRKFTK